MSGYLFDTMYFQKESFKLQVPTVVRTPDPAMTAVLQSHAIPLSYRDNGIFTPFAPKDRLP